MRTLAMTPNVFRRCLILTGPTGSGKSAIAVEHAPRLNAEIVCMDSMTLYRGMDIGTAKPSAADRAAVPHHLLDVLDPGESASVAWWLARAAEAVADIERRGKQALLVGGTALYLKAVQHGLMDAPSADLSLREQLEREAAEQGNEALHARLRAVDPQAAERIHPNNVRRVVRALEVFQLTGQPLSQMQSQWDQPALDEGRVLCLTRPRDTLYARIDARVDAMMAAGLLEEVRRLRERPISREASQALGYKELFAYLEGATTLAAAVEEIRTRSRQFAKRQLTWFRHLQGCRAVEKMLTEGAWGSRI
jgi:tRNA dimethylallyltransferase